MLIAALAALAVASVADVLTTRAGLRTGAARELNPLMRWFAQTTARALSIKTVGIALLALTCWPLAEQHPVLVPAIIGVCAIVTGWIAWQNYRLVRAIQRG